MEAMKFWISVSIERHNMKQKAKKMKISIGDVVLIKNEDRNRRKWKIGIVDTMERTMLFVQYN